MDASQKGLRVRNFFEIEAKTLLDRYKVIETLLPHPNTLGAAHRGEEGRFIETLLRAFLNKHLPANLRAVSGFILCLSTKTGVQDVRRVAEHDDRHSSQLDIIVYDLKFLSGLRTIRGILHCSTGRCCWDYLGQEEALQHRYQG